MIRCTIIDDEKKSIQSLKWKLERCPISIEVIQTFQDPLEALTSIPELDFDILFLDIEMPSMDGFQFLNQIARKNFATIFVTAHDEHILEALRASALDYLTKPVQIDDLTNAIHRYISQKGKDFEPIYQILKANLHKTGINKIALPTNESVLFVEDQEILYCSSDSNYTTFHLHDNREITVSKTLKNVEKMLGATFLRIHNSFIINLQYVESYYRGTGGSIKLKGGSTIPVSKSRRDELLERLRI